MSDGAEELRSRAARVADTAADLLGADAERIVEAVARACADLSSDEAAAGREARALLPASTGLSAEMVDWALRHQVGHVTRERLRTLLSDPAPTGDRLVVRARLAVAVLAGNVFTASLHGLVLPLLARVPVVAKASSRDDVFPHLFHAALSAHDPDLAASVEVVTFPGTSTPSSDAPFAQADVVSVWGGDATLAEIRCRLPATTAFVGHGHGLGVAYVPADALADRRSAERIAERIALDVAAYDQRGCLSPHAVWVERGAAVGGRELASILSEGPLARLARELPRGPLPAEAGGPQVQWRGVAASRGELFEGDGWAASWEDGHALRLSPGHRNVAVLACDGERELVRRLLPLGGHLKALGLGAEAETRRRIAASLPAPLAPLVSEVGEMQRPPFGTVTDGLPPFDGLVRWMGLR